MSDERGVALGADTTAFNRILEEVGAQLEAVNMDLDNVDSETDRIVENVDKTVIESKRQLAGIAERVRRTAQAMIFLSQAVGFAFGQAFNTAIEMVALTIEVLTSVAAAESLSVFGVVKVAFRIQLIAQLAAIQVQLIQGREQSEQSTERAVAGIYRIMSYAVFPPIYLFISFILIIEVIIK